MSGYYNYFYKVLFSGFLALWALLLPLQAHAAENSPIPMLQTASDQMISELRNHQATLKTNPQAVFDIVHRILLPHVDMSTMARAVAGRTAWLSASPADQQAFIAQFTNLLIRTYAAALASYSNQSVKFLPIRGNYQGESQVQVQSEIIQPGGPSIPVSYRVVSQNQEWKVVDFSVDNVSIVENFRAQFANDLNQGSLATLTAKLAQHNAQVNRS